MYKIILKTVFYIFLSLQFNLAICQECDYSIFSPFNKMPYVESLDMDQYEFPSTGNWYTGKSMFTPNFNKEALENDALIALSNSINIFISYEGIDKSYEDNSESGISKGREQSSVESIMRSSENLKNINYIYIKFDNGYQAIAYRCKIEQDKLKEEAKQKIKDDLRRVEDLLAEQNYQMAFDILCHSYIEEKVINDANIKMSIESKLIDFIQNLYFEFKGEYHTYLPNEYVEEQVIINSYYGELPLNHFKVKIEVVKGRLTGEDWDGNKKFVNSDSEGYIYLNPLSVHSTNDVRVNFTPDLTALEEDYSLSRVEKLKKMILKNIGNTNYYKISVDNYLRIDPENIKLGEGSQLIDQSEFINNIKNGIRSMRDGYKLSENSDVVMDIEIYEGIDNYNEIIIHLLLVNHTLTIEKKYPADSMPTKRDIISWLKELRNQYKKKLFTSEIHYRIDKNVIIDWIDDEGKGRKYYNAKNSGRDTLEVIKGNVNFRFLLKDNIFSRPCFLDTSFVASEKTYELNGGSKIRFSKKENEFNYKLLSNGSGNADFKWDGKQIEYGVEGYFTGFNDLNHTLSVKENRYNVKISYDGDSSYSKIKLPKNYKGDVSPPILIRFEEMDKKPLNYLQYLSIPGYGQYNLFPTSSIRKLESGLLFIGTVGLFLNQRKFQNKINHFSTKKENCLNEWLNLPDNSSSEEFSDKGQCASAMNQKELDYINKYNFNLGLLGSMYLINFMDIVISWNFPIEL